MAKDRAPSMQWYPDDFENDPAVVAMSLAGCGAYMHLLNSAWNLPEPGVLPDDDTLLARWARATPKEWRRLRAEVERAFDTTSRPGYWLQKRMMAERYAQAERFRKASEAGRKANATRWGGRSESDANRIGFGDESDSDRM